MYNKSFHPSFKKDLKDFTKVFIQEIKESTDEIIKSPYNYDKLTGNLSNYYKYKLKHNKVEYRLIFTVEENNVIFIMIKKRENLYSYLKRRLLK